MCSFFEEIVKGIVKGPVDRKWLTDRRQRVVVDGEISLSGVPKGSVIGPLLCLIHINDLGDNITSIVLKFVDDKSV